MEPDQLAAAFVAQARERITNTFIDTIGMRLIDVNDDRALAEMAFAPNVQQLTGVFHAGALIGLADTTATFAALYWSNSHLDDTPDRFPFTIQLSSNLLRNTNQGVVHAEATAVHRGRTTMVIETRVRDANDRLLVVVTTTHLFVGR